MFDIKSVQLINVMTMIGSFENPNHKVIIAPTLRCDIETHGLTEHEPKWALLEKAVKELQYDMNIQEILNPYHNVSHAIKVHNYVTQLLGLLKNAASEKTKAIVCSGALTHDRGHCGKLIRQNVYFDTFHSNEEYTATIMDPIWQPVFSTCDRLRLQGIYLATSFGQSNPSLGSLYRNYAPITLEERLVCMADVGVVALGSLCDHLKDACHLAFEYGIKEQNQVIEFLTSNGQLGFYDFAALRLQALEPDLTPVGYRRLVSRLNQNRAELLEISENRVLMNERYGDLIKDLVIGVN